MKNILWNLNAAPFFALEMGRLKRAGYLRYVAQASPLNFASKLRGTHTYTRGLTSACPKLKPFSEQWCKEKKLEILKAGLPAVFKDMSKMKQGDFAVTNFRDKPLSFYSLKDKAGIYMITNYITKKCYIGMSKNLKARIYNYLIVERLIDNKSSRIHKALLKYGYSNFSLHILEFIDNGKASVLKEREDYYIRIFKPQYNIARSYFNLDVTDHDRYINRKVTFMIPVKIKYLLDKALDPNFLDWHLITFNYNKTKKVYTFSWITPKAIISANSSGWFEGNINKQIGYNAISKKKSKQILSTQIILDAYKLIDKEKLAAFYTNEKTDFVIKQFKSKTNALKILNLKANTTKKG